VNKAAPAVKMLGLGFQCSLADKANIQGLEQQMASLPWKHERSQWHVSFLCDCSFEEGKAVS
jgi:hypothetical protein